MVVVHRVVRRGWLGPANNYLITRGDAALIPDPPVGLRFVLGPVVGLKSEEGWAAPGEPAPQPPLRRFLSSVMLALMSVALEIDVQFAGRFAVRLRACRKSLARLCALPRRGRS
jgi:hypothetical protein